MPTAISIQGLSKRFNKAASQEPYHSLRDAIAGSLKRGWRRKPAEDFWALRDINLDIQQGERIGIIGRNGAGKSTLLKILSRISPPTSGRAIIEGRVASLLEVGTGFHPELTGRENIYLNGSLLGLKRHEINRRMAEIIDFSGVGDFMDTPLKHYSSGMQLRLDFSVAAHLEPEILMIDEVLAVGDVEFQRRGLLKMEAVNNELGRTILFVSHNLELVRRFCHRVVLLDKGQVQFDGPAAAGIEHYYNGLSAESVANRDGYSISGTESKLLSAEFDFIESKEGLHHVLQISATFFSHTEQSVSFEAIVRDALFRELIFAPGGLKNDIRHEIRNGTYKAVITITTPFLASGGYSIDLILADTGKTIIDSFSGTLKFEVAGTYLSKTGWTFQQSMNQGSVLGDARSSIEKID